MLEGNQEIFVGFGTLLTSIKWSQQMYGIGSPGLLTLPTIYGFGLVDSIL
jgi:hypothetical protein